jgi:excinuclease UvrABC nuclease subunit
MTPLNWVTITDLKDAPGTCGVYAYWAGDTLLYIGKAINLKARLLSHAQNAKLDAKEAAIVSGDIIKYTLCDTEFKALLLESKLIRKYKPPHNRAWKDDKTYLYIAIDLADPYPRPHLARAHDLNTGFYKNLPKLKVYGPFPNTYVADEVLRAIRRLIPFCMAKKVGKHACFYSRIGLCNPCPANIEKLPIIERALQKRRYRNQIRQVIKILEGNVDPVIKELTKQMKAASNHQDFETALAIRTKIERFSRFILTHSFTERHFSYNNSAEKLQSLRDLLKPYLGDNNLNRIECYDASNSALKDSVVSLVVMTDGLLNKGQYRRFKIKNPRARSDFDRLDEALSRRLKNKIWDRPDLIVIDGGTPQVRRLQQIFDRLPDPPFYLGLAKRPDRLVIPNFRQDAVNRIDFINVKIEADHPGIQLLAQLRDEAHRFANAYRKILEKKRTAI